MRLRILVGNAAGILLLMNAGGEHYLYGTLW